MKVLIAYASKYGCTEKCAVILSEKITGTVELCNLKDENAVDFSQYDKVIIGSSVYMGKIRKEVSRFCTKNLEAIKGKKVGLFICCMREGDIAETELRESFPPELLTNSVAREYFGGEFVFEKMNPLDRFIVKKVVKVEKDQSNMIDEHIDRFAELMNGT